MIKAEKRQENLKHIIIPQKRLCNDNWKVLPRYFIKPLGVFFLDGFILIDINSQNASRFSNMNYFKSIRSSILSKELDMIYLDYTTNISVYDSFDSVIPILQQSDNYCLKEFGGKLRQYEMYQKLGSQIKKQMQFIANSNAMIQQIVTHKRQEYENFRLKKLKSLPKDKYFALADFSYDYNEMKIQFNGKGMNQNIANILGTDLEHIQQIFMRKGMIDFLEPNYKQEIMSKMMEYYQRSFFEDINFEGQVSFITLDEIQIDTKACIDIYFCKSPDVFESFFQPEYKKFLFDKGFIIIEFKINNFHINKISGIRMRSIELPLESESQLNAPLIEFPKNHQEHSIIPQEYHNNIINLIPSDNENDIDEEILNLPLLQTKEINQEFQSNQIQIIRNNFIDYFTEDIPYSIQSQHFLDQYYGKNEINKGELESKNEVEIQREKPQKRCCYKVIKQY